MMTPKPSALCAQVDPDLFFPPPGGNPNRAKKICGRCPHLVECREEALADINLEGVAGGLTMKERQRIRGPENNPIGRKAS